MSTSIRCQTRLIDDASGTVLMDKTVTLTGGRYQVLSESIANGASDTVVAFENDFSATKLFALVADGVLTVKTNSGADQTFVTVANQPIVWDNTKQLTNPITTDITTDLLVSNASGGALTLQIWALEDPTP